MMPAHVLKLPVPHAQALLHDPPEYEEIDPADLEPRPFHAPKRKHMVAVLSVVLILLGLVLGPPLVNVSRYKREIASSISASLGRPVHMDRVSLNLLPAPSFTLENFVVSEDPAFGFEPILRANSVRATLRLSSLWRHKVEFSTITLTDPSVNLVHLPDGRWNLQSILLQASRVPAAPTVQKKASDAPRFPYIEATGARVNLKMGLVKQPLSLTEARFALWLPEPNQWHLRLEGHPNRTDVAATDTGKFSVEGVLGRAATLEAVPVDLAASWSRAPLGGVSGVMLGRDADVRGELTLHATVRGTFGDSEIDSWLEMHEVRRADFMPAQTLDADIGCRARALDDLHRLDQIVCHWPRLEPGAAAVAGQPGLSVTGSLPDLMHPASVDLHGVWTSIPAGVLLQAARSASQRISPALSVNGMISGEAACCAAVPADQDAESPFSFTITGAHLAEGDGPALLDQTVSGTAAGGRVMVEPLLLHLGGATPAALTADVGWDGFHMHLAGPVLQDRLLALAAELPIFGDGLEQILPQSKPAAQVPIVVDAEAKRAWFGGQSWTQTVPMKVEMPRSRPARRRR